MNVYPDILALEKAGDLTGALKAYRDLYLQSPKDEAAVYGIAQCALALGNLETAFEFFVKLLILNHDCPEAYIGRANVLFQYDQRERAMSDLARAIALENPASMLRIDCAAVLNDNGLSEFAMQALAPIREMAMGDDDFKCEWVYCLMAAHKLDHPDVKSILTYFYGAIEHDPYYAFCLQAYQFLKGNADAQDKLAAILGDYPEFLDRATGLGLDIPE